MIGADLPFLLAMIPLLGIVLAGGLVSFAFALGGAYARLFHRRVYQPWMRWAYAVLLGYGAAGLGCFLIHLGTIDEMMAGAGATPGQAQVVKVILGLVPAVPLYLGLAGLIAHHRYRPAMVRGTDDL